MKRAFVAAALALAVGVPARAQIGTGAPNGGIAPVGKDSDDPPGSIPTAVAQTFLLPAGANYLQTFSFFIRQGDGLGGIDLKLVGSVYEFDSSTGTLGTQLYASPFVSGTINSLYQELKFGDSGPLNVLLSPGTVYALVLSSVEGYTASPPTPDHSTITIGTNDSNPYDDGSMFVSLATTTADYTAPGSFFDLGTDAAFTATFSPNVLPEPTSVALVATGLIVLGAARRRRRRVAQTAA